MNHGGHAACVHAPVGGRQTFRQAGQKNNYRKRFATLVRYIAASNEKYGYGYGKTVIKQLAVEKKLTWYDGLKS